MKKMESEFISSTSHQFRTPLATMQSSAELLEFYIKKGNTERELEILEKIKRSISILTDTLERITELYKLRTVQKKIILKRCDPRKIINEILEEVVVNIGDKHLLGVNIDREIKSIKCDAFILKQILINLIGNAVKFSPDGGQIKIDVRREKGWILLSVRDEGIGIDPGDMKNLFQPFFRGKNAAPIGGAGLGLAIIKNLIRMHGGRVECRSKLNEGTEVIIRIRV